MTPGPGDDPWAPLADLFVDGHYGTVRGAVRTRVLDAHLRHHLAPPPAAVVDVGGGAGNQSVPLAAAGYSVVLVDPSGAMLDKARARLAAEPAEVAGRVELVQAGGEEAPDALGGRRFEGVLCHGVIMYLEDPEPLVAALARLAAPGAVVSVAAKNAACLATQAALRGDWDQALAAFDSRQSVNGLGVETRADTVDELSDLYRRHGVDPVAWYGVRLFTDGWRDSAATGEPTETMVAVELEASRRDPYRQLSRMFHLVGRRR